MTLDGGQIRLSWSPAVGLGDPRVWFRGEDVTSQCVWVRLEPGGKATIALREEPIRVIAGELATKQFTGKYHIGGPS